MKEISDERALITPAEAGKMIGLSGHTIRLLVKEGALKCVPHIWSGRSLKIFAAPWIEICRTGEYKGQPIMGAYKEE